MASPDCANGAAAGQNQAYVPIKLPQDSKGGWHHKKTVSSTYSFTTYMEKKLSISAEDPSNLIFS